MPSRFINDLQTEMREVLRILNAGLPNNLLVGISRKRNKDGWITVTPFDPQPDPANLVAIKAELNATWPMTSLLDMLKETDLRLNFTRSFEKRDSLRDPGSVGFAPKAVAMPEWPWNERRFSAHGRPPIRHDRERPRLRPTAIHRRRCGETGYLRHRHQRHTACPRSECLGRRNDGLRG